MFYNSTDANTLEYTFHMKVTEEYPLLPPSEAKIAASVSMTHLIFGSFVQVKKCELFN